METAYMLAWTLLAGMSVSLLGLRVGLLQDVGGWMARHRPSVAGLLTLALMGMSTGSALGAPSAPMGTGTGTGPCDLTQGLCIDPSGILDMLKSAKADVLLGMGTAGVIAAAWGLRHGFTGKGWGAAAPAVVGGLLVSGLCANIAAGGVQKMLTGT